jgi:hypothetical protein
LTYTAILLAIGLAGCGQPKAKGPGDAGGGVSGGRKEIKSEASTKPDGHLIVASGMGGIQLGMSLEQAQGAFPAAKFERTSDGDGAALVEITIAPDESMVVWTGEDDPAAPIDWSKRIKTIETFSPNFHTAEGVHPGALVTDVEIAFGKAKEIQKSEIESREYIEFERQPAGLTFRLDYTGIFSPGSPRRTTKFDPAGKIFSIAVSSDSLN